MLIYQLVSNLNFRQEIERDYIVSMLSTNRFSI